MYRIFYVFYMNEMSDRRRDEILSPKLNNFTSAACHVVAKCKWNFCYSFILSEWQKAICRYVHVAYYIRIHLISKIKNIIWMTLYNTTAIMLVIVLNETQLFILVDDRVHIVWLEEKKKSYTVLSQIHQLPTYSLLDCIFFCWDSSSSRQDTTPSFFFQEDLRTCREYLLTSVCFLDICCCCCRSVCVVSTIFAVVWW